MKNEFNILADIQVAEGVVSVQHTLGLADIQGDSIRPHIEDWEYGDSSFALVALIGWDWGTGVTYSVAVFPTDDEGFSDTDTAFVHCEGLSLEDAEAVYQDYIEKFIV